ncbi:MAG: V-type ATP synthase subunit D [Thermoleophilia bacterium]
MSTVERMAVSRMNLSRARRRLAQVERGVGLLRRKREALVSELFQTARPAVDARMRIEGRSARAYTVLVEALALQGQPGLRALGWPGRDLRVDIRPGQVWGVPVSDIEARPPLGRTPGARGAPPGSTGLAAAAAAREFELLADLLLDAAPREMLLRRLGEAVSQTSRQVNTLELRVAPGLSAQLDAIRRALDEREREERLRLKHLMNRRSGGRAPTPLGPPSAS